jgi:hypothetical protein
MRLDASYNLCSKFGSKLFFFVEEIMAIFFSFARPFLDFDCIFHSDLFLKVELDKIYAYNNSRLFYITPCSVAPRVFVVFFPQPYVVLVSRSLNLAVGRFRARAVYLFSYGTSRVEFSFGNRYLK